MVRPMLAALAPFLLLFGVLYAGFGVQSPFLPVLFSDRGLSPEAVGAIMAAGTAIRLVAGPVAGRLADRFAAPRLVFALCAGAAAIVVFGYRAADGFGPLLAVAVLQAAMLAPLAPLSNSLVLAAAAPKAEGADKVGFDYGWVRGAGSGAFILGSVLSGQLVARFGLAAILWLHAGLLALAALWAPRTPDLTRPEPKNPDIDTQHALSLFRLPEFRRVMLVAALVLGSHALHDNFAMIRWTASGIGADTAGMLWAEAVAAEVVVFLLVGRPLLNRLGPAGAALLAVIAGIVRWAVSAETAWLPVTALIQPLHGVTFALLHLACMQRLAETVPPRLSATALSVYGTVAIGAMTALLTLVSGVLYGAIGPRGFWVMAALCALALPFARRL